jgi:polyhydroxyalkanoate synthesis regulator phasin
MSEDKGLFERLKERGDEMLTQVSGELMQNPHFMRAMEGALRGKQALDDAAARALRGMNIPTRSEFKRALSRLETLEHEVAALKAKLKKGPTAPRGSGGPGGKTARGKKAGKGS